MLNRSMITSVLYPELRLAVERISDSIFDKIEEIRLRTNKPVLIHYNSEDWLIDMQGHLYRDGIRKPITVNEQSIMNTLELISDYSLYAFEEELRNGYITIEGGHRVGITGKVVMDKGKVRTIRYVSSLNIRIAHEVLGCANKVIPYIVHKNAIYHTLIVSPPKCGKTTLLRDIIRQLSEGNNYLKEGVNVGVVDERSEIAGCYKGIPQNNIGMKTDVLDCCPKVEGMMMLLRSMAPKIIAVDEIGTEEDLKAIEYILNAGIKLICTVHGSSLEDIGQKPVLRNILKKKIFQRIIILSGAGKAGTIKTIMNEDGDDLLKCFEGMST